MPARLHAQLLGRGDGVRSTALAVRARTADLTAGALATPALVRTWAMRGTLHVLAAEDLDWLLCLLAPAVLALREGLHRLNADKAYAEDAQKAFGFVPVWRAEADNNAVAARSITLDAATRAFLQDYIKNPPK